MPLHVVIDVRRIHDFGIGTYIRNLIRALGAADPENRYTLIASPSDQRELPPVAENFAVVPYERSDLDPLDHAAFPWFLRRFAANLFHIPLSRVPLFMLKPYVVT